MTAEENIEVVRRQFDAWNAGDLEAILSYFADEVINHGFTVNRDAMRHVVTELLRLMPDGRSEISDIVALGDTVVMRLQFSGTHTGTTNTPVPIMGGLLRGVPPTGKTQRTQQIHIYRLRDGLIAEHYANRDDLGMLQQLGLLPTRLDQSTSPSG